MLGRISAVTRHLTKNQMLYRTFAQQYDLVVVGGGPGGYVSAIKAAQLGLKVACVEERGSLGGTCLNVGCIPSKALLNISHKYHDILHHGKTWGIKTGELGYDWGQMQKQKAGIVTGLTKGIEGLLKKNKVDYKIGHGRLTDANTVQVEGKTNESLSAKNILLCSGSVSKPFPGIPTDEKVFITSTGALALETVPETMTIVGAGVIGLELGSVYARLGTKVHVVEFLDRICPFLDKDMSTAFQKILAKLGMTFQLSTKVLSGGVKGGKAEIHVEALKDGKKETHVSDVCLMSIGRDPYTGGLGLESVGIETDKAGRIPINENFQTQVPTVYAIGDVVAGPMLAHKAEEEGVACVENLAGKHGHINYNTIPNVIYTHPEVAWVGKTEMDLKEAGIEYKVGSFPMMANSRARANLDSEGMIKLLSCKKTDRLLGAHIIAPQAGELIHELTLAIEYGASSEDVARVCHAHPTLSEGIKEAALGSFFKPIHF